MKKIKKKKRAINVNVCGDLETDDGLKIKNQYEAVIDRLIS